MKKIIIDNRSFKVTKKEISYAIESWARIDVASDFLDTLIFIVRTIDDKNYVYTTTKKEKIDWIYENINSIIKNAIFHYRIVSEYFGVEYE